MMKLDEGVSQNGGTRYIHETLLWECHGNVLLPWWSKERLDGAPMQMEGKFSLVEPTPQKCQPSSASYGLQPCAASAEWSNGPAKP